MRLPTNLEQHRRGKRVNLILYIGMWTYQQATGALSKDGEVVGEGYSGFGEGKNNPMMQQMADVGPLPQGLYEIGPPHDTPSQGPHIMELSPADGTELFGRSGFLIHGDAIAHPGSASHGCIILSRDLRDKISASGDNQLRVV
jgi:Protein of unknown function (DUF2778)